MRHERVSYVALYSTSYVRCMLIKYTGYNDICMNIAPIPQSHCVLDASPTLETTGILQSQQPSFSFDPGNFPKLLLLPSRSKRALLWGACLLPCWLSLRTCESVHCLSELRPLNPPFLSWSTSVAQNFTLDPLPHASASQGKGCWMPQYISKSNTGSQTSCKTPWNRLKEKG